MIKKIISDYETSTGSLKKALFNYLDFKLVHTQGDIEFYKQALESGLVEYNLEYFVKYFQMENIPITEIEENIRLLVAYDYHLYGDNQADYAAEKLYQISIVNNEFDPDIWYRAINEFFLKNHYLKPLKSKNPLKTSTETAIYHIGEMDKLNSAIYGNLSLIEKSRQGRFDLPENNESIQLMKRVNKKAEGVLKVYKALKNLEKFKPADANYNKAYEEFLNVLSQEEFLPKSMNSTENIEKVAEGARLYLNDFKGFWILWTLLYDTRISPEKYVCYRIPDFMKEKLLLTDRHNSKQIKSIFYFLSTLIRGENEQGEKEYFFDIELENMDKNHEFIVKGLSSPSPDIFNQQKRKQFPLENPAFYIQRIREADIRRKEAVGFCMLIPYFLQTQRRTDFLELTPLLISELVKALHCDRKKLYQVLKQLSDNNIIKLIDDKIMLIDLSPKGELFLIEGIHISENQKKRALNYHRQKKENMLKNPTENE